MASRERCISSSTSTSPGAGASSLSRFRRPAARSSAPSGRRYSDLAIRLGKPAAVRAVGAANGRNPIPIVIPCHRVIGRDGKLVGFGGGLAVKRQLLALEQGALF